jgi:nicotinic acid mononucleotide adenylyltransferase
MTISAADCSVKIVTRSQIIPVDISTTKIKGAKSIGGSVSRGLVTVILKYYHKINSYKVKLDLPDENDSYID